MATSHENSQKNLHSGLYTRLSILVSKLYKAEKLYSGIRRSHGSEGVMSSTDRSHSIELPFSNLLPKTEKKLVSNSTSANIGSNYPMLVEHSNELRSTEWHKIHQEYRVRLNELLSVPHSGSLQFRLENLKELFLSEFEDAEFDLYEAKGLAREALEKEEFSHLLKISAEIIRRKAKLQAMKVIHDELEALQVGKHRSAPANLEPSKTLNQNHSGKVVQLLRAKHA